MEEVMKNFLETYKHIINTVVAVVALGCLFYLGSTMEPEDELISPVSEVEVVAEPIATPEPVIEVVDEIIEPEATPEPEIVVEPEPVLEVVVKEVVEVDEDTVVTDVVNETIEVEIDSAKAPVEVMDDSTHTNHMTTDHPEVTVSVNGYLVVPDSVDNIVNAFVYAAERVGRNTYFEWRDSTYTTENFYANKKRINN